MAVWVDRSVPRYFVVDDEDGIIYALDGSGNTVPAEQIGLVPDNEYPSDIAYDGLWFFVVEEQDTGTAHYRYSRTTGVATIIEPLGNATQAAGLWTTNIDSMPSWFVFNSDDDDVNVFVGVSDLSAGSEHDFTVSLPQNYNYNGFAMNDDYHMFLINSIVNRVDVLRIPNIVESTESVTEIVTETVTVPGEGGGYAWIPAENVFTAQRQLVTLLAVIAAIGMPVGAMTAIVFFGQAVISAGVSGQGASQVMVAIAAVVIILVAVQMFQQFATYLGDAFDSVNGDRFVVFDETLGSLAETIAEFWGP